MSAASALISKTFLSLAKMSRILKSQSAFKSLFVLSFAVFFELGLWWLFLDGFRFLANLGGTGVMIISRLFAIFFLGMAIMLVISNIVSAYSTIYRSDEIIFLMVRPVSVSQLVFHQFAKSVFLASWAFFFVIIPFIGAYAWQERLSALMAVWTFLFSIPFLVVCGAVGTLAVMAIVRWLPYHRVARAAVWTSAAVIMAVIWWCPAWFKTTDAGIQFELTRVIPGLGIASNPLLPSWWVSEGITALNNGDWFRGFMLWNMLASTAVALCVLLDTAARRIYLPGWERVVAAGGRGGRRPVLFSFIDRLLRPLPGDIRALLAKDIRVFLRDPMQWSQALIFFGLLALYFLNLRSFNYHTFPQSWRNTITFLNVFSVSAVMCSLGSRFIYPQMSLEGHGFWVLGLSPTTMTRVLLSKLFLAIAAMSIVSVTLMSVSSSMLKASGPASVVANGLAIAMSLAVSGLSIGLGAVFLDLETRNPAEIVSGYGGTLNLVLSLFFMLAVILPFGIIFHIHLTQSLALPDLYRALLGAGVWVLVLTAVATAVPLWLGAGALRKREF
ncbi:MAG: hypothetical protein R6V03_09325 [Kiritimatiellia bacterium]